MIFFFQRLLANTFFPHGVKGFYLLFNRDLCSFLFTCALVWPQTSSYLITSVINHVCVVKWCTQCVEHISVCPCHLSQLFFKTWFFQKSLTLVSLPSVFHPNCYFTSQDSLKQKCLEKRVELCRYHLWFILKHLLSFFSDYLINYPAGGTFGQRSHNVTRG